MAAFLGVTGDRLRALSALLMGLLPLALPAELVLVWSDEFEQPNGSAPNPAYWNYDIGGGGWGNGESQYYTNSTNNSRIEDGHLVIELRQDVANQYPNNAYTSARLLTKGKLDWKYGRIEARLQVPDGAAGLWPAFWMLGSDIGPVPWPLCGEIDIMEYISRKPNEIFGTIHGPGYSGGNAFGNTRAFGGPVAGRFYTYTIDWEPNRIRWYVDGELYHIATPASVAPSAWVFEKNFFIILNLAIGGNFGGAISSAMTYPQRMLVDYVRVYQDDAEPAALALPGRIQAEDYTVQSGVQFQTTTDLDGGLNAGFLSQGDYLEFTLDSPTATTYAVTARVASGATVTGRLHLSALGQTTTSGNITNTGGWQTWTTVPVGEISLPAGVTTVRATIESPGPTTDAFNLNWLDFSATGTTDWLAISTTASLIDENEDGFASVGETIRYTFRLENTGGIALTDVSVSSPDFTVVGAPSTPANLLENQGFEATAAGSAPSGWDLSLGGGTAAVSTAFAETGTRSLAINSAGADAWTSPNASQSFSASPGEEFVFQGYLLTPTAISGSPFGLLKMEFRNAAGNVLNPASVSVGQAAASPFFGAESTPRLNSASPPATWVYTEVRAVAPANTVQVSFYALNVNPPATARVMHFDQLAAIRSDGDGPLTLAAGAIDDTTFSAEVILTEADLNAGQLVHRATATSSQSSPALAEWVTPLRIDLEADFDGDGLVNLLERAFGLDLFQRDAMVSRPTLGQTELAGETYLTLTYRRRTGTAPATSTSHTAGGFTYEVETSPQLGPEAFADGPALVETVGTPIDHGDGTETVTVRLLTPLTDGPLFLRLRVTAEGTVPPI